MSKKRTIAEPDLTHNVDQNESEDATTSIGEDSLPAKSRRIDSDLADPTIFASITHSDDEEHSSFEFVEEESKSNEPYMSQLRTPPKLNESIDEAFDDFLGNSGSPSNNDNRPAPQNISFGDQDDDDNEEGSGGGSSAASTAADIMREMLEEFPRSNDTLVINSREESDEEAMDDDFQYNEKFEMMLQDDASPSLPHGFEFATSSHQDSDQPEIINDLDNKANPFDKKIKTQSPSYLEDGDLHQNNAIENKSSNPPPLPIIDLPPLPVDKEKRPPSPPVDHQGQITLPKGVKENANSDSKATELAKNAQTISNLDKSAKQASVRNKTVDDKGFQENFKDNTSKKNSDLITMEHEENDESEDDWSDTEDIAIDLLDADLSKKALSVENTKEKKKEPHEKIRSFLVDRGKNHFTVLPEGWIQVRHFSGMPVFLHKQTRVVTLSKPYVIGPHSVKSHHIPLGSIPCLNYQKAKEEEESLRSNIESHGEVMDADVTDKENCTKEDNIDRNLDNTTTKKESTGCPMNSKESNKNSKTTVTAKFPMAKISSLGETKKAKSLSPDEFKNYCSNLFEFREVKMKSFQNWKQKRLYNKEINANRLKAQVKKSIENAEIAQKTGKKMENPSLPDHKLITIPILEMQKNDEKSLDNTAFNRKITKKTKKDWIFNPKNKTPVCILHEYLQHSIKQPPEYKYEEIDSAKTPYSAVVLIDNTPHGTGVGTSKKQAKSEAALNTLAILIPNFMKEIGPEIQGGSSNLSELPDVSYFDSTRVEDPRVSDLCMRVGEPSPYAVLITCLQKNYGLGDTNIETNLKPRKNKKNEFTMKVNNREVSVICKNKKDGKQLASQKLLQLLHPQIQSWGSLLRLYGSPTIQAQKLKKEKESEVTVLQSRHSAHPSPSQAILEKLKEEMRKLSARKKDALPIGKLTIPGTFPGENYGTIGVAEKINL